jgi:hypothetical protein
MSFEVRILNSQDVGLMRRLIGVFAKAFGDSQTYLDSQPSDAYLSDLLGKSHFIVIVATIHELVAGGLVWTNSNKIDARSISTISPSTRGIGVAVSRQPQSRRCERKPPDAMPTSYLCKPISRTRQP